LNKRKRRVVVTGMGVVTAIGDDLNSFWDSLIKGKSGIGDITLFDTSSYRTKNGAQIKKLKYDDIPYINNDKNLSRADLFGIVSAKEAIKNSGLIEDVWNPFRFGISLGAGSGGIYSVEQYFKKIYQGEKEKAPISLLTGYSLCTTTDYISKIYNIMGPRITAATVCSSSLAAIGFGIDLIRNDLADIVIAGGSDSLCEVTYSGFNALRIVDPKGCKPFDKTREGISLGEGAGIIILEEYEHALSRNATIVAEMLGYAICAEAYHLTAPSPDGEGAKRVMELAMKDAKINPSSVDTINTHGTGTPLNDIAESIGIKKALKEHAHHIPVCSIKGSIGHCLGSAGAIEAISLILTLVNGIVPPTVGLKEPDPKCDLNFTIDKPKHGDFKIGISNSFAFGGNNVSLIISRFDN